VEVDRLIIGVSETYDVIVTIPKKILLLNFCNTRRPYQIGFIFIGSGIKQLVSPLPKLKYFEGMKMMNSMMKMNGDMTIWE
jgi:hypothetical protein